MREYDCWQRCSLAHSPHDKRHFKIHRMWTVIVYHGENHVLYYVCRKPCSEVYQQVGCVYLASLGFPLTRVLTGHIRCHPTASHGRLSRWVDGCSDVQSHPAISRRCHYRLMRIAFSSFAAPSVPVSYLRVFPFYSADRPYAWPGDLSPTA